jgi:hypothetical protein
LVERCLNYIVTVSEVHVLVAKSVRLLDSKAKRKAEKAQKMMLGQLISEVF